MRKLYRFFTLCLVTVLLATSLLSVTPPIKAKATTTAAGVLPALGALGAEKIAELLLLLGIVVEGGIILGGAIDGTYDFDTFETITDNFLTYVDESALGDEGLYLFSAKFDDGTVADFSSGQLTITTADGVEASISFSQFAEYARTGTITLDPDDTETEPVVLNPHGLTQEQWDELRYWKGLEAYEVWLQRQQEGGGSGQEPDDDDGDDTSLNTGIFKTMMAVGFGSGIFVGAREFLKQVMSGEVEGLEPETVFLEQTNHLAGYYWDGEYDVNEAGEYVIRGFSQYVENDVSYTCAYNTTNKRPLVIVRADSEYGYFYYCYASNLYEQKVPYVLTYLNALGQVATMSGLSNTYIRGSSYINLPVFNDKDAAVSFLTSGDSTGIINVPSYYFSDVVESTPEIMQPLTDVYISPDSMVDVNTALKNDVSTALQTQPQPELQPDTATQTLIDTLVQTMTETKPQIEIVPSTDTETKPDTETETQPDIPGTVTPGTGTDTEDNSWSDDVKDFINGLLILIYILFALLQIFLHCLEFIMNLFRIEPTTGYINEDMLLGLNYIKALEIPGIGMSVYDFLMGLVYILIVFYFIRILRMNIDHIRIPKQSNGG